MKNKTKIAIAIAILLWASAFVGIRACLHDYSPAGLALLRYLVASVCIGILCLRLPARSVISLRDKLAMLAIGCIGIGVYNISLNYGEVNLPSGIASFIVGQSPVITALFALVMLGERLTLPRVAGFIVSIAGVVLIALSQEHEVILNISAAYIIIATFAGSFLLVMQKPYLKKYHAIETTAYVIWGGTLFLLFYIPSLRQDLTHASMGATLTVIYLGIFPAAIGYLAWSYALNDIPASRAASMAYFIPFIVMLMGWVLLGETPVMLTIIGGALAIIGVMLVNRSYSIQTQS